MVYLLGCRGDRRGQSVAGVCADCVGGRAGVRECGGVKECGVVRELPMGEPGELGGSSISLCVVKVPGWFLMFSFLWGMFWFRFEVGRKFGVLWRWWCFLLLDLGVKSFSRSTCGGLQI